MSKSAPRSSDRAGWQTAFPRKTGKRTSLSNALVILCVDDEPVGLAARHVLLSVAGYAVLTAQSRDRALKLLRLNHVDLVIITGPLLSCPNPADLISEMKRLKPEVPIVLFSDLVDMSPGYQQADLQLTKGITPPKFLAELAALIATRRSIGPDNTHLN
jgi:CheY-like chemotaxis protein